MRELRLRGEWNAGEYCSGCDDSLGVVDSNLMCLVGGVGAGAVDDDEDAARSRSCSSSSLGTMRGRAEKVSGAELCLV